MEGVYYFHFRNSNNFDIFTALPANIVRMIISYILVSKMLMILTFAAQQTQRASVGENASDIPSCGTQSRKG